MRAFSKENIDSAPTSHGVYALYQNGVLTYYGRASGDGVTIRSRLQAHHRGDEGRCTQQATAYQREVTEGPIRRESELLEEYRKAHGRLPQCNEQSA